MQVNMGTLDRVIRAILAIGLAVLVLTGMVSGIAAILVGALAAVFLGTGAIGYCPLYAPFGFRTCPPKAR